MKNLLKIAVIGGMCAFLSVPALARDWSGFWVGGFAGGMWVDKDATIVDWTAGFAPGIVAGEAVPQNIDIDGSGFVAGAEVGYNMQNGMWVYGLVADISSGVDGSTVVNMPAINFAATTTTASFDLNWLATLRGRVGALLNPNLLVFVTGGLAIGDVDYSMTWVNTAGSNFAGSTSETEFGWTLGGGLEYAFNSNWSVEVEALYFDLGDERVTLTDANFPNDFLTYEFDNTGYTARVGVKYKFGSDPAPEPYK